MSRSKSTRPLRRWLARRIMDFGICSVNGASRLTDWIYPEGKRK